MGTSQLSRDQPAKLCRSGSDAQPNEAEVSRVSERALPPQTTCTPAQSFALDSVLLPCRPCLPGSLGAWVPTSVH